MSLATEFKEFAMRGNVVDLAVGVVIGAAFGKIVSALVEAIVMPALGWVVGGINFSDLALTLGMNAATNEPVLLKYGVFLQAIFDFLIIAFAIFLAVKGINRLKKPPAPAPAAAPPSPPRQEVLLEEIRDLLKKG
ncbi:MAG: large-conductance mechanosensitive channel protein MscL [Steroidobacteraceae bacterium]